MALAERDDRNEDRDDNRPIFDTVPLRNVEDPDLDFTMQQRLEYADYCYKIVRMSSSQMIKILEQLIQSNHVRAQVVLRRSVSLKFDSIEESFEHSASLVRKLDYIRGLSQQGLVTEIMLEWQNFMLLENCIKNMQPKSMEKLKELIIKD